MNNYSTDKIRNFGLFGHQGSGKTSLAEALIHVCGASDRLGKVDDGNTQMDFDTDEVDRKMSIFAALAPLEYEKHKLNCLDTPGFFDFVAEVVSALRVSEGTVLVASGNSPVEVGLEQVWDMAEQRKMPRILFVNKMDKENADFQRLLDDCQDKLSGSRVIPLQLPIGSADTFTGVVNLVTKKAYKFEDKGEATEIDIPADLADQVESWSEKLTEEAAESSEALMEKYFETMELSDDEIREGLNKRIQAGLVVPALCGSATKMYGIKFLMNAIIQYVPNPGLGEDVVGTNPEDGSEVTRKRESSAPLSALVFKTTTDPYVGKLSYLKIESGVMKGEGTLLNPRSEKDEKIAGLFTMQGKKQIQVKDAQAGDIVVVAKLSATETGDTLCDHDHPIQLRPIQFPTPYYSQAIFPKSKGDEDKLSSALSRILQEVPTMSVRRDSEVKQTILTAIGDLQVALTVTRLKRAGVEVELAIPKVPYKETIRKAVKKQGRHKKQTGGRGQFADVWLEVAPGPEGSGFEFVDSIVGGVVPKNYIPGVEKGVRKAISEGVLAGYEVLDVRVTLYDGSYHPVDSSDMAFQIAGGMAFKSAVAEASPALLEPYVNIEVRVPENYMGDVIGDLNAKRGKVLGMEPIGGGFSLVKAQAPMAEMMRYSIDLRSITQGRGSFTMEFCHYEQAPPPVVEAVVAASKAEDE
ncbi:MAG: elongation factor G [Candidatus Eremiobacteraeota bacterium]|nr:elongation factor G [Candidatus Eremiobacteraeota bacterium]